MPPHDIKFKPRKANAFVREIDDLAGETQIFTVSPVLWKRFPGTGNLAWSHVDFARRHRSKIPKHRGVYCFALFPTAKPTLPPAVYPVYIGETGNNSRRTLRTRFGEYLREAKRKKRPHIFYMLNKWKGHLKFYYAPVPDRKRSLTKIETLLTSALVPPFVQEDFVATFRAKINVLRKK